MTPSSWVAVLCGPTGSGKTMFARLLAARTGCLIASTDGQRLTLFGERYPQKDEWARSRDLVYSLVDDVIRRSLESGFPVVVDGVNSTPDVRYRSLKHAHPDRTVIVAFKTLFDNEVIWKSRGYGSTEAGEIRRLHLAQHVPPGLEEARYILDVDAHSGAEKVIAQWPL